MNFRNRLMLFLVLTLIAIQVLTGIVVYDVIRNQVIAQGKAELKSATEIFVRELDAISGRVSDAVEVLALDYPLRSAIAANDHETALSALRNHGRRVGATRMILVGLDGSISADTLHPDERVRAFRFPLLLEKAAQNERGQGLASIDGSVYWMVAVPVRAPVPIAFIVAFLPVDDALAETLKELSALPIDVSFVSPDQNGRWHVAAHTRGQQPGFVATSEVGKSDGARITKLNGDEYLTLSDRLPTVGQSPPVIAVLDYPLADALHKFRSIIRPMAIVLTLSLIIALAGALLIARGISRPLEALAATTRRIEAGDYAPPPPLRIGGEVGLLGRALISMTQAIGQREHDLATAMAALEMSRDEAVRANRAKSEFLANMSHELRTPLNAVLGFSEMMKAEVLGALGSPRYRDYAASIHDSGRHLLDLVADVLDLARVEAGKLVISRVATDPASVLEESLVMLRAKASGNGVALELAWDAGPLTIPADPVRLKQVFVNTIGNAIKFTPRGGRVHVSAKIDGDQLAVLVNDTGIGMRSEDIPLVVKPFHRLSSAFDAKYQGAGLGLPIAKAAVELHGGRLDIESALGVGTTVTVRLPIEAGDITADRAA